MKKTVYAIRIACVVLGILGVAGAKAGDTNPPPPPGGSGGHGHRPPPSADQFFKRFDLNNDGVVTFDEFVKGHATPPPPPPAPPSDSGNNQAPPAPPPPPPAMSQEQLQQRFNSLDANGDGKITREEYEAALKRGPPPQGQGGNQQK